MSFPIQSKRTTVVTYVTLIFADNAGSVRLPATYSGKEGDYQLETLEIVFNGSEMDYTLGTRRYLVKGGLSDQLMKFRRFALPQDVQNALDAIAKTEAPK